MRTEDELSEDQRRVLGEMKSALQQRKDWDALLGSFVRMQTDPDDPYSPDVAEDLVELIRGEPTEGAGGADEGDGRRVRSARSTAKRNREPITPTEVWQEHQRTLGWFAAQYAPVSVAAFRRFVLSDRLIPGPGARAWLNERLRANGRARPSDAPSRPLGEFDGPPPPSDPLRPVREDDGLPPVLDEVRIIELKDPASGRIYWARVLPGSDEDWLRRLSEMLSIDMGWTKPDATLWVLSGVTPPMDHIRATYKHASRYNPFGERIEMSVDPAVPANEVARAYQQVRARRVDRSRMKTQSVRALTLVRFVDEHQLGRLTGVPAHPTELWRESMVRWNETYPDWRYVRAETFESHAVRAWTQFLRKRPLDGGGDALALVRSKKWRRGGRLRRLADLAGRDSS